MNTPESDMEQMKFAREWVRKKAKKRMEKLEKKTRSGGEKIFRTCGRHGQIVDAE